jgi:hypothetical protein
MSVKRIVKAMAPGCRTDAWILPGNDVRRRHDVHDGHAHKQHDVLRVFVESHGHGARESHDDDDDRHL